MQGKNSHKDKRHSWRSDDIVGYDLSWSEQKLKGYLRANSPLTHDKKHVHYMSKHVSSISMYKIWNNNKSATEPLPKGLRQKRSGEKKKSQLLNLLLFSLQSHTFHADTIKPHITSFCRSICFGIGPNGISQFLFLLIVYRNPSKYWTPPFQHKTHQCAK